MRKILLLGIAAALAATASASAAPSAAMDIAAIHRSVDTAALPVAPVIDYTP